MGLLKFEITVSGFIIFENSASRLEIILPLPNYAYYKLAQISIANRLANPILVSK